MIRGAFFLELLGAGERAWGSWILDILGSGGLECLGSAVGFGKAWKCFNCLNLDFRQRLGGSWRWNG